ncbi:MAG: histidine--tRNA ligase [Halanaerobiales bacterium]
MENRAPRGTNDILPPESSRWQYIENRAREILGCYNYQEIRTPIFEYTELFQRGIGEATDIVTKEMYTFTDKGGRSLTLRPEGTASIVRAFLEHKLYGKAQPRKYYYLGPMFRYERPQSGRYRQFNQLGVEVLGSNDPLVDVEVITLGMDIVEGLGLKNLDLYINSIGCPECRNNYVESLKKYLRDKKQQLCDDCKQRINSNALRVLDCKNQACQPVIKNAPRITDYLCSDCSQHFDQVKNHLDTLNKDYMIDPLLVRGLDYYTNTAFEIKYSGLGAQDTIFGGGRYNGLAEEIGSRDIPGIGFAIGLERLLLTLECQKVDLREDNGLDLYLTTIGERARKAAFKYLHVLRRAGLKSEMDYNDRSVKGQMKAADRLNANFTIILGENELSSGTATIRNMKTGSEKEIKLNNLVEEMQELL